MDYVNMVVSVAVAAASAFAAFKVMELRVERLEKQVEKVVTIERCDFLHARNEERIDQTVSDIAHFREKLDEALGALHRIEARLEIRDEHRRDRNDSPSGGRK